MKLKSIKEIRAEYETVVASMQKVIMAKNTAGGQLEEARKDTTVVGTGIFRTRHDAYIYYSASAYQFSRADVDRKIEGKEISICARPEGIGSFNDEQRWVRSFREAEINNLMLRVADLGNEEYKHDQQCRELLWQEKITERVTNAGLTTKVQYTSKTSLEREVRAQFLLPWPKLDQKWYCWRGRPIYNSINWHEVENEKDNNRVVTFVDKDGVESHVAFLRKIGDSDGICWGFRTLGTMMFYLSDKPEDIGSMRELCERIMVGKEQVCAT